MHAPRLRLECEFLAAIIYAGLGLTLVVIYGVSRSEAVHQTIYHVLGCGAPAAILYGVRRYRPPRPLPWLLIAVGTTLGAAADFVWDGYGWAGAVTPFPSAADPFYLVGEILTISGLVVLARRASAGIRRWLLDSLVVAVAGATVLFVVLIGPIFDEPATLLERLVAAAYPVMDVLLLLVLTPLVLARARNVSVGLLVAYGWGTLVSDVMYGLRLVDGSYVEGSWIDVFWLIGFVAIAAAAIAPAMQDADRPVARSLDDRVRLGLLALAMILVLVVLAGSQPAWDDEFVVVAAFAGLTIALVIVRVALIYSELRHTADQLRGEQRRLAAVESAQRVVTAGDLALDRLLHVVCSETAAITGGGVSIALLDGERLVIRGSAGSTHLPVGHVMARPSIAQRAIEQDRLIVCGDERFSSDADHDLALVSGTRAITAAPLHFGGSAIGAIVATHASPFGLTSGDARTLELMASLVSVAVNRSSEFAARRVLAEIVDSSDDAIIAQTLEGVIVSWNRGAERMFGWTAAEMVGAPIDAIVPAEIQGELVASRRTVAKGLPIAPFETERLTKNGARITLSLGLFPIRDESGKVVGLAAIGRDITAQKQLEQQLFQAQKMEAVGRLAGGIAHDFNNLLLAIEGYGSLLRARVDDEQATHYVDQVLVAARRSAELTQQLLAYSRKQVLNPTVTSLNEVVEEIRRMLDRVIGEDIALTCELSPEAGEVLVDRGRLAQIVMNLGVNARDAMPHGGSLSLATALTRIPAGHPDGIPAGTYSQLTVSDTGIGMDDETRAGIFEPFFTTKEEGKGTGLGLATVQGTVAQSGGCITVDSALGHGTVFSIYLPQCAEQAADEPGQEAVPGEDSAARVLLVEDQPAVCAVVKELLEQSGYEVVATQTPDEALRMSEPFDLLLTDIVMPGMSGIQLADRLRESSPGLHVLLTSGYPDGRVDGLSDHFLQKPYSPRDLQVAVRGALAAIP